MNKFDVKLPFGYVLKVVVEKNDGTLTTKIADFVALTFKEKPNTKDIQISVIAGHFKEKNIPVTRNFVMNKLREIGYEVRRGRSGYCVINPEYSKGKK